MTHSWGDLFDRAERWDVDRTTIHQALEAQREGGDSPESTSSDENTAAETTDE